MNYWIFKANPDKYRIDDRMLNSYPHITWAVTRYHDRIQKGDTVFIWRGGTPRGICAVMLIDDCPYDPRPDDLNDGFEIPPGSVSLGEDHWARGHIIQRFALVEASAIKKIPGLELFSFFSAFQQAINFTVTRPEASILLEYIEAHKSDPPVKIPEKPVKPARPVKPVKPAKPVTAVQTRTTHSRVPRAVARPATVAATLLKCDLCSRFVISTDTDRHAREAHPGQQVEWQKLKPGQ